MGNVLMRATDIASVTAMMAAEENLDQEEMSIYEYPKRYTWGASCLTSALHILSTPPAKKLPIFNDEAMWYATLMKYPNLDVHAVNIAIMGGPSAGKMSLINAFLHKPRKVSAKSKEEEKKVPTMYTHPTFGHIRLWYLPDNYGEHDIPDENYYFDLCLYAFDLIMFIGGNKIRPGDLELAKQARSMHPPTPVAFVRSKIDGDLIAQIGRVSDNQRHWEHEKDKITNRIRRMLNKQLEAAALPADPQVWLISQGGILDLMGVEENEFRYVVDDFHPYIHVAHLVQKYRSDDDDDDKESPDDE